MPTIIKPGVIPTPKRPWYLETTWTCGHCGCEFRVDGFDDVTVLPSFSLKGQIATFPCPTCGWDANSHEPAKTRTFDDVVTENAWLSPQPVKRYLGDL